MENRGNGWFVSVFACQNNDELACCLEQKSNLGGLMHIYLCALIDTRMATERTVVCDEEFVAMAGTRMWSMVHPILGELEFTVGEHPVFGSLFDLYRFEPNGERLYFHWNRVKDQLLVRNR
jgi:hypothetical protein